MPCCLARDGRGASNGCSVAGAAAAAAAAARGYLLRAASSAAKRTSSFATWGQSARSAPFSLMR
eukprot:4020057-Lingulodinium_polyedra.AAC.1